MISEYLKIIKIKRAQYCKGIDKYSGVNPMFIIKNSDDILDKIKTFNMGKKRNFGKAKSVQTFDFSTLYTTIPHHLLKEKIKSVIHEAFKGRNFIVTTPYKTYWSNNTNQKATNVDETYLLAAIDFLIDNIYILNGDTIYRQTIGIPMGTNCAPLLADLFLHYYEYDFIMKLKKKDVHKARKLCNTARYIDDLITFNNPDFVEHIPEIYPKELTLKETTESIDSVSYLDLLINIEDSKFITKIFDKREQFNFTVINYPYMDSNIPVKPALGVYTSQLIRYAKICTKFEDFQERNLLITKKLLRQGYKYSNLVATFKKFHLKYNNILTKYKKTLKCYIKETISLSIQALPSYKISRFVTIRKRR